MALSAAKVLETRGFTNHNPVVQDGAQVWAGAYLGTGLLAHATVAKRGTCYPYVSEAETVPLGFAKESKLGSTVVPRPRAYVDVTGPVVENLAVAGLSGDETDVNQPVYATADDTFTLTQPGSDPAVGIVVDFVSSAIADVKFFSFSEMRSN